MVLEKNRLFVFSSVGSDHSDSFKHKVYKSWELYKYDNACVKYNLADKFSYNKYFNTVLENFNYKFLNFIWFNKKSSILDNYQFISLLDDDLLFNQSDTLSIAILNMIKYSIDICSLSNDGRGKKSWYNIMNTDEPKKEILLTNFCEMGSVIMTSNMCKNIIEAYYKEQLSIVDFGFDLFYSKIANDNNKKIGIFKNLTYYNPPLKKSRYTGKDLFEIDKNKTTNLFKSNEVIIKEVISLLS